jgi:peptide methionine sulfoxide reductase MsrA
VVRTRVGYSGGVAAKPTYRSMRDHTEAIQIDYNPAVLSYADMCAAALRQSAPSSKDRSVQYRSAIFPATADEHEMAVAVIAALAEQRGRAVFVDVELFKSFTLAEGYHQKFYLQQKRDVLSKLGFKRSGRGGDDSGDADVLKLVHSPLAARANAFVAGKGGTRTTAAAELRSVFGVTDEDTVRQLTEAMPKAL